MNRRGVMFLCAALLLSAVLCGVAYASPKQWPDPRRLLQVETADELSDLLAQLKTALDEASVIEDRVYVATVYQVAGVAKSLYQKMFPHVLPPDGLDKLERIRQDALRVGAPLIAEEMFAEAYEELGFAISALTEVVTGKQSFSSLSRSQLVAIIRRDLSDIEGLVTKIEGLMPYVPKEDAFAPQNYAYFVRKLSTIRLMVDDLDELLAGVE